MRTPHTSTYKGKRVFCVLKNGDKFIDKFKDKKGNYVIFDNHKVVRGDIKVFTIVKGNPQEIVGNFQEH